MALIVAGICLSVLVIVGMFVFVVTTLANEKRRLASVLSNVSIGFLRELHRNRIKELSEVFANIPVRNRPKSIDKILNQIFDSTVDALGLSDPEVLRNFPTMMEYLDLVRSELFRIYCQKDAEEMWRSTGGEATQDTLNVNQGNSDAEYQKQQKEEDTFGHEPEFDRDAIPRNLLRKISWKVYLVLICVIFFEAYFLDWDPLGNSGNQSQLFYPVLILSVFLASVYCWKLYISSMVSSLKYLARFSAKYTSIFLIRFAVLPLVSTLVFSYVGVYFATQVFLLPLETLGPVEWPAFEIVLTFLTGFVFSEAHLLQNKKVVTCFFYDSPSLR